MKKYSLFIVVGLAASVCFANRCCRCSTTAPLRKVKENYYCNKHYCAKHKLINDDGKCQMCELESILKRGKGECLCCKTTKNLSIVKYAWNHWGLFCANHYCAIHNQAPYRIGPDSWTCPLCKEADNIKKREQEKVARQKAKEAHEKEMEEAKIAHEREMAEIAKKTEEERERMRQKREQDFKDLCALKAKPLEGLFGVNLGASQEDVKGISGEGHIRVFAPRKVFRNFSDYAVAVERGRVCSIYSSQEFKDWDDAETELELVVRLFDKKFGLKRRGEIQKELFKVIVCYEFGCDPDSGENPKQRVYITARKARNNLGNYIVMITAEDSVVNKILHKAQDAADIEAL